MIKLFRKCVVCEKEFETYKNAQKCCSDQCREARAKVKYELNYYSNEKLICLNCNKTFIGNKHNKFCSSECRGEHTKNNLDKPFKLKCAQCGGMFSSAKDDAKFCSNKCRRRNRYENKKIKGICVVCGNEFETSYKEQKSCSVKCEGQRRRQDAKERNTDSFPNGRARVEYKRRQRKIKTMVEKVELNRLIVRDKGICQLCGELVDLRVHYNHHLAPTNDHIIPLALGGETSYENCQLAHRGCNSRKSHFVLKGGETSEQGQTC